MRRDRIVSLLTSLTALLTPGCGDHGRPAPDPVDRAVSSSPAAGTVAPARYLSGFAFTGMVAGASQLYLELVNRTSESTLARDYGGWIAAGDGGWTRFLALRDTIPAPRAAWRILPGDGLHVLVGDASEIVGLAYADSARRLRLQPSRVLAEWTGPTGQREALALATLQRDSIAEPGLLYFRRAARTASAPADRGTDRLLLLGDARGNGLLVAQTDADTADSAFAWGWLEETRSRWNDVRLRPLADPAGEPGEEPAWALEIAAAGIAGELRPLAAVGGGETPVGVGLGEAGSARLVLVAGTIRGEGAPRPVRGILLQSPLP